MRDATKAVHHPIISTEGYAALSVPTHRASTIVFEDSDAYATRGQRDLDNYSYGMHGTPTQRVLEAQLTELEGGLRTVIIPSGQAAIAIIFLSVLKTGDHVLIAETAYPPAIGFCRNFLELRGISFSTYPPGIGAGIEEYITDNTKLIWMESPGSTTMEVEDVPAIVSVARGRNILTGIDNTWATPLLFKPLAHGVDFSMQALTKYPSGHSDILMGSVTVNDLDLRKGLRDQMRMLGMHTAPDAISLVLRGLETMALRLTHVGKIAGKFAAQINERGDCEVLFPALPESPGHDIWKRDFSGSSGLFSVVLPEAWEPNLDQALDAMQVFAIGASWGGTHSLIAPMNISANRDTPHARNDRIILRINIGLEDPADIGADLDLFFQLLSAD
ncbi:trans-sulfuration enzyme family protein [Ahrensia kielensis]|uniref:trans-sulfuration enzyme family protein n=1 Tax=Ahrensia kielensis TaxID=76980 RepID=UPI00036DDAC7|nr:PLP-dependent transferase [Ahrensia kielensis]